MQHKPSFTTTLTTIKKVYQPFMRNLFAWMLEGKGYEKQKWSPDWGGLLSGVS